jgi:peptidoglycan/LPS O-acetylase OafA/YrhL
MPTSIVTETNGAFSEGQSQGPIDGGASLLSYIQSIPRRWGRVTKSGAYVPAIDGLRFWAIATVILGHLIERIERAFPAGFVEPEALKTSFFFLNGPGAGVLLFFAVSGFILSTQLFRRGQPNASSPSLGSYYLRRATRIEPPYIILILLTYFVLKSGFHVEAGRAMEGPPDSLTHSLIASLLYCHRSWYGSYPHLFGPGWSLEVEVQFYILAPVLLRVYLAVSEKISRRMVFGLVVFLISIPLQAYCEHGVWGHIHLGGTVLRFFLYFWLGVLVADIYCHRPTSIRSIPLVTVGVIAWTSLFAWYFLGLIRPLPTIGGDVVRLIFALSIGGMFLGALRFEGAFARACSMPWIAFLGGCCYSLYLTHLQVEQVVATAVSKLHFTHLLLPALLQVVISMVFVLIIGLAYYRLIERPFMSLKWSPQQPKTGVLRGVVQAGDVESP